MGMGKNARTVIREILSCAGTPLTTVMRPEEETLQMLYLNQ